MNVRQNTFPRYLDGITAGSIENIVGAIDVAARRTRDGRWISIYRAGNPESDCMILLPPVGMSFMLVARLAIALSENYYVLTWESMGCPNNDAAFTDDDLNLELQAAEFEYILKQEEITRYHFTGWCQAVQLIVQVASTSAAKPETLSLIAPAGLGCSVLKSEFDKCALPIYLQIEEKGVDYANKIRTILDKFGSEPANAGNLAEKLSLVHLVTPETTYLYSRYVKSYNNNKNKVNGLLDSVIPGNRVLLVHCMDDNFSHYSESVQLSKRFPAVRLEVSPRGGHLLIFNEPEIIAKVVTEFIRTRISVP